MNNLKYLLILLILLVPFGCGEEGMASVDVLKKRITNQVQSMIGKGDIAIAKYENKIKEVKNSLIKVKVSHKTFEKKLLVKKASLATLEAQVGDSQNEVKQTKLEILRNHVQEMEAFLQQLINTETKLGDTFKKLVANLDIVKLKIASLEAKRDMLSAMSTIQEYENFGTNATDIGGNIDGAIADMQKDIYAIEAEIEVEELLNQANTI